MTADEFNEQLLTPEQFAAAARVAAEAGWALDEFANAMRRAAEAAEMLDRELGFLIA